ncbi:MAG: transposase [Gemmatimonadaceae bacterium]
MRPSRFSEKQVRDALRRVRDGTPAVRVCRELGVTETTFYRWRRKFESRPIEELRELQQLREENERLKRVVANLILDRQEPVAPRRRK